MKNIFILLLILVVVSCKDDKKETYKAPDASFSIQSNDGMAPEEIQFTNNSTDAEDFVWFFGDGQASEQFSPTHQYKQAGTFTIKLKVFGQGGKDSVQKTLTLDAPSTLYRVRNSGSVPLENIRSFYLDWDEMLVYDIIEHGNLSNGNITEEIPTTWPSIEVLFQFEGTFFQLAFPESITKDILNTINIYDTSSCFTFDDDPITSSSIIRENNKKLIRVEDLVK